MIESCIRENAREYARKNATAVIYASTDNDDWSDDRHRMVEEQIRARGISDARVLEAMLSLPRERFVPADIRGSCYEDRALPIGHRQTISQPFIAAYMTEQLELTEDCKVLEIGTGTGYQTAILAMMCKHVFSVERIVDLQRGAARLLAGLKFTNITLSSGDGSTGLKIEAPFDRIMVTAGAPSVR